MGKIGILTFWKVPNYGAFAQAYALNNVLKKVYDEVEVVHLGYLHHKHRDLYYKKRKPTFSSLKCLVSPFYYIELIRYYCGSEIKRPSFEKDWESINHIILRDEYELERYHCDVIVTGSDAIWEYSIPEFGDDIHLIGNNLNCDKLVSYAASFGDMNPDDEFKPFVKTGLEKYDMISVRDENSKKIVRNILEKDVAKLVLDPTLLWDFKNDERIPKSIYNKYILVYGNDFQQDLINDVINYARKFNLTIIGAGIAPEWCDVRLADIGPLNWIGLFKKATFVVTCTFHGLMFGINFEKKVVFNQVEYVKNRSMTLLKNLGLYELFSNGTELNSVLDYEWDYKKINKNLGLMRMESIEFISEIYEKK